MQLSPYSTGSRDDMFFGQQKSPIPYKLQRRDSVVSNTTTIKKGMNELGTMINQYVIIKKLGKGCFATVLLCEDSSTGEKFAVKKMNKKTLRYKIVGKGITGYDCVKEELNVLKKLDHPNIIWLHEIIDD